MGDEEGERFQNKSLRGVSEEGRRGEDNHSVTLHGFPSSLLKVWDWIFSLTPPRSAPLPLPPSTCPQRLPAVPVVVSVSLVFKPCCVCVCLCVRWLNCTLTCRLPAAHFLITSCTLKEKLLLPPPVTLPPLSLLLVERHHVRFPLLKHLD